MPNSGDADHAGEHRDAHGVAHLRAGAGRCHQRQHAHHEGQRGHQDRPQPQAARLDRGLDRRLSGELELARELHDQDGVLRRKADQHDQPDLGEDVVVAAGEPHAGHRGEQAQRHDHDDRERQREAFIQRREHEEDQQDRERKHQQRGIAGKNLLIGQIGPFEARNRSAAFPRRCASTAACAWPVEKPGAAPPLMSAARKPL